MYSSFLPKYNSRIAIPCDYTSSIFGQNTSGLNYDISVVINLENGTPPTSLKAHLASTESGFAVSWGIASEANHVVRAMYPNASGTTVDFAGGIEVVLNYSITLDATWVNSELELVFFMQDDVTKEVLQGTKVMIDDLIPLEASAAFSCSNLQPCETTSVDFYDNSLGLVTSWEWSFEGGTPATSTAQNPTVTYNTPGIYDVQLIADDGTTRDTLLMTDYVEVITTPVQANVPSGPTDLCGGYTGYTYTTSAVVNAATYNWAIDPASAGTITPNGTSATIDIDPGFSGSMDVKVRADNQCGNGVWSQELATTVFYTPVKYWISNGAGYCVGTQGIEVTLDGSETGVDYELLLDGNGTGIVMAGTGSMLNYGYQTGNGIYTIVGNTDYCEATMYGNAYIHEIDVPGVAAAPTGEDMVCAGEENIYTTDGATDADTYFWTLTPSEAGAITGNDLEATVVWSATYSGTASITVQGSNDCGDGVVSDAMDVTVEDIPEPVISGDEFVFANTTHTYSADDNSGASYDWSVTGGTIDAGQGTYEITVTWGAPGTGYINLTETSAAECDGIAEEKIINIDPVGIEENTLNEVNLYPNPVSDNLNVELTANVPGTINIYVVNQVGQIAMSKTENNNSFMINISDLENGIYTMKITAEDGTLIQKKFVVMK